MMKGVILAGGKGTRLRPLTNAMNKHLLPVGKEPMIYNPVKQLKSADIDDICVVTSTDHMGDIVNLLGSGKELGVNFTYKVQDEPKGIAHALLLTEDFAGGEKIVVILGDNIATYSIKPYVDNFRKQEKGARVLLKEVGEPERYGVAALDEQQVLNIEEKPDDPDSNLAVIGYYMYDDKVFDIIREQTYSDRGELEITDVNNHYIDLNELHADILGGKWMDAGTHESFKRANEILSEVDNEIKTYE